MCYCMFAILQLWKVSAWVYFFSRQRMVDEFWRPDYKSNYAPQTNNWEWEPKHASLNKYRWWWRTYRLTGPVEWTHNETLSRHGRRMSALSSGACHVRRYRYHESLHAALSCVRRRSVNTVLSHDSLGRPGRVPSFYTNWHRSDRTSSRTGPVVDSHVQNSNFIRIRIRLRLLAHGIMREWKRLNGVTSHGFVRAVSASFYHSVLVKWFVLFWMCDLVALTQ